MSGKKERSTSTNPSSVFAHLQLPSSARITSLSLPERSPLKGSRSSFFHPSSGEETALETARKGKNLDSASHVRRRV